ncbi:F-box/kelch-repeat protein At3g06240-like [Silene latifolia]|uniref:F-box/kelch-repeat protein At3g06240-like n=1 Tax=Silene latifolia TaxID=37657 RepID=UPI003D787F71
MKRRKKRKTSTNLRPIPKTSSEIHENMAHIPESKHLPPEVWTQILAKLPAKTVLRFRCVCKSWCSIIDSPNFVNIHLQLCEINVNNKLLLALEGLRGVRDNGCFVTVREAETLRITGRIFRKSDFCSYHIIGSCNGLFLVNRKDGPPLHQEELRLWNPCIWKSLILLACPLSPSLLKDSVYLFGFDLVSKDYKVVAIAFKDIPSEKTPEETTKTHVAVYTLSDQKWTVRKDCLNIRYPYRTGRLGPFYSISTSVFFRGSAYWLGQIDIHRNDLTHLGCFDFDSEKITFLKLPFTHSGSLRFLFLLGGSLAVFSISLVTSSIWVLQQDNQKLGPWTLWFSGKSSWNGYHELFKIYHKRSKKKVFYCESDGGYFVWGKKSYNIVTCNVGAFKRSLSPYIELQRYSENLVLLKGYGARDLRYFP